LEKIIDSEWVGTDYLIPETYIGEYYRGAHYTRMEIGAPIFVLHVTSVIYVNYNYNENSKITRRKTGR